MNETGAPPLPPEIRQQQQGDPLSQMADRAGSQGQPQQPGQGDPTGQFIMQGFQQISQVMMQMMQAMASKAPQLVELMTKLASGFKEVENQYKQSMQQGTGSPQKQNGSELTKQASEDPSQMGM